MYSLWLRAVLVSGVLTAWSGSALAAPGQCPDGYWCQSADGEPARTRPTGNMDFAVQRPAPAIARRRLHAFSLRLTQLFGNVANKTANLQLTGLGMSYRVRPMAWLGVEPTLDLLRGTDGYESLRTETHLGTDLLFYLNPRHAVQLFGLAGANLAFARYTRHWAHSEASYLGVQFGMGLEFRVTHRVSFNVNAVGYSRKLASALRRDSINRTGELVPQAESGLQLRAGGGIYF